MVEQEGGRSKEEDAAGSPTSTSRCLGWVPLANHIYGGEPNTLQQHPLPHVLLKTVYYYNSVFQTKKLGFFVTTYGERIKFVTNLYLNLLTIQ